jgi:hypothetical protein
MVTSHLSEISALEEALNTLRLNIEAQNKIYQSAKRYLLILKDN